MLLLPYLLFAWLQPPQLPKFNDQDTRALVRAAINSVPSKCVALQAPKLWNDHMVMVFAYSVCDSKSVSRTIGPYFVDLQTGDVMVGSDDNPPIQSQKLTAVRQQIIRRKSNSKR
jgi:hypothetical protein